MWKKALILLVVFLLVSNFISADGAELSSRYAEIIEAPDKFYVARLGSEVWREVQNPLVFPENIIVKKHYKYFNQGHVLRVRQLDTNWAEVIPESGQNPYASLSEKVYIPVSNLRFLERDELAPLNVYSETQQEDKLIVVLANEEPVIMLFEGSSLVLKVPVVLGPTPYGDFRVFNTRASDDMPSLSGVPFVNYFTNGFAIHGSPWWNWKYRVGGGYGSHGCINLPGSDWFRIEVNGRYVSVDEWIYRWISTNLDYDEFSELESAYVSSMNTGWYTAKNSVRTIVVKKLVDLYNYPPNSRLDKNSTSRFKSAMEVVNSAEKYSGNWLITHIRDGTYQAEEITLGTTVASVLGEVSETNLVMLTCHDPSTYSETAFDGSAYSMGEMCNFIRDEVPGAICFVDRKNLDLFGQKILCSQRSFELLPIIARGELIEHERVHVKQYSGYFKDLFEQGISATDESIGYVDFNQLSTIGIAELMAQTKNANSVLEDDYKFALASLDPVTGLIVGLTAQASVSEAWLHLHKYCGVETGKDEFVQDMLTRALSGEKDAYLLAIEQCQLPPHVLVPDRIRQG